MGEWVRAKACSSHSCIEASAVERTPGAPDGSVIISDVAALSDNMDLWVTAASWRVFVEGIKNGDFDQVL